MVKAGEKLKMSKKKAKMPSASTESRRDWGRVKKKSCLFILIIVFTAISKVCFSTSNNSGVNNDCQKIMKRYLLNDIICYDTNLLCILIIKC